MPLAGDDLIDVMWTNTQWRHDHWHEMTEFAKEILAFTNHL